MKKRFFVLTTLFAFLLTSLPCYGASFEHEHTIISAGLSHSLAVKDTGKVIAWGSNEQLQLGQPDSVRSSSKPLDVPNLPATITDVAAGHDFSAALAKDGTVYVWGNGKRVPQKISQLQDIIAISAGQSDVLALKKDGTVFQLDVNNMKIEKINTLKNIAVIAAGSNHFLALTNDGYVWAWGSNTYGESGKARENSDIPVKMEDLYDIIDISAGSFHSLAVRFDGTLYSWGDNEQGQLGDKMVTPSVSIPVKIDVSPKFSNVAAGSLFSMALTTDGKIYTWGNGEYGQLGNASRYSKQEKPELIEKISKTSFLSAGFSHVLAISDDGKNKDKLFAWGRNNKSQLATSENRNADIPTAVPDVSKLKAHEPYAIDRLATCSNWSKNNLTELQKKDIIPPIFWNDYQKDISRDEFAHLVVSTYLQVTEKSNAGATANQPKNKFIDISGSRLRESIDKVYSLGFMLGNETHFRPSDKISREEASVAISKLYEKLQSDKKSQSNKTSQDDKKITNDWQKLQYYYDDIDDIALYARNYICYAYENDLMKGSYRLFEPTKNITREEALSIIYNIINNL